MKQNAKEKATARIGQTERDKRLREIIRKLEALAKKGDGILSDIPHGLVSSGEEKRLAEVMDSIRDGADWFRSCLPEAGW